MDTRKYKFNKKSFWGNLFFYLLFFPLLFLVITYTYKGSISKETLLPLPILIVALLYIWIYPTSLIISYYYYDYKTKIIFCEQSRTFYYENEDYSIDFSEHEIDCIITFFHIKFLGSYHEILFKNGFSLYITPYVLPYKTIEKNINVEHLRESVIFPKFLSQDMNTILNVRGSSNLQEEQNNIEPQNDTT